MKDILVRLSHIEGGFFWRNNTGTLRDARGVPVSFGCIGSGDILGCYLGRFISIEVKTDLGIQSEYQRTFERAVRRAGGIYILARSVDEALSLLWEKI